MNEHLAALRAACNADDRGGPAGFFSFPTDAGFEQIVTSGFQRPACDFRHENTAEGLHPQVMLVEAR